MNFQKKCIQLFLTFTQKAGHGTSFFVLYKIISDTQSIRKEPADGNRPPDSRDPENRESGQCVSKGYTGSERHDCQDHRHPRFSQCTVQSVEQEEDTDQCVESAFDAQIADALGYNSGFT